MRDSLKGFTLIELMVTLAVTAIVLTIAIPSFQAQILNNRSISLGEDFAAAINYARAEAIKRAGRVSICASKDGETCTGDWTEGFIAFVDNVAADTTEPPVVKTVLRVWTKQDPRAVMSVKNNGAEKSFIRYTGLGTLARITDKPFVISTAMKKCTGSAAREINIGLSGLVSVKSIPCSTN